MTTVFSYIRKNGFYLLIVFVLLLSYSLSQFVRSAVLIFFEQDYSYTNTSLESSKKQLNDEGDVLEIDSYSSMVSGNFVRGKERVVEQVIEEPKIESQEKSVEIKEEQSEELRAKIEEENRNAEAMILTGILYSSYTPFARATFSTSGKPSIEFRARQKIGGDYSLRYIRKSYVVLKGKDFSFRVKFRESIFDAKEKEKKRLEEEKAKKEEELKKKRETETNQVASLESSQTVRKVLSRVDLIRQTKDITKIYQGSQFGPHFEANKLIGYKIYSVRKDHIFYSLGARSGDIIKRVNGIPVENAGKMMEIWNALKDYDKIIVDLDRKGKIVSFEFVIES